MTTPEPTTQPRTLSIEEQQKQTKLLEKINEKLSFFTFILVLYIAVSILNFFLSL